MTTRAVQDSCYTQVEPIQLKWTINNFNPQCFNKIESNELSAKDLAGNNYTWKLTLSQTRQDFIEFSINKIYPDEYKATAVEVSILDNEGNKYITGNSNNYISRQGNYQIYVKFTSNYIYNIYNLTKKSLTILCEIYFDGNIVNINQSDLKLSVKRYEKMSSDFANLFQNPKFSDVTIKLKDGREFKAHKAVLAARSDVFAAMFEHNMMENMENCVTITDVDSAVCEEMLRFIYTGTLLILNEMLEQLLIVADKYQLADLKLECEQKLSTELTISNGYNTLYLAHRYNLDRLKKYTIEFLNNNSKDFVKSVEFGQICNLHPELLKEMYMAASESP